jgi:hypothetical protein
MNQEQIEEDGRIRVQKKPVNLVLEVEDEDSFPKVPEGGLNVHEEIKQEH